MAEKFKVEFEAELKDMMKDFKQVKEDLKDIKEQTAKTGKGFSGLKNPLKGLTKSFKGITALAKTAFGFGVVLTILEKLKEAFMQNQTTADLFNKIGVVLQGTLNALISVAEPLIQALTDAFTKPQESIQAFKDKLASVRDWIGDQFLDRMREQFSEWGNNLGIVFQKIKGSILGVFSDEAAAEADARIAELRKENEEIDKSQEERNNRLKDTYENIKEKVIATKDAFVEQVKATIDNSDALANAEYTLARQEILQKSILEQKDAEAEKLRQIRDNEFLSLEERIAANTKLGEVITEQADMEKATLDNRISLLQKQQSILGFNRDRENEILALTMEKEAVDAKIVGFQSEQQANLEALKMEELEIANIKSTSELETQKIAKDGVAEMQQNELKKLEYALARMDAERDAELQLLKDKRDAYAEDSVQYAQAQADIDRITAESAKTRKVTEQQVAQAKLAAVQGSLNAVAGLFKKESKTAKALAVADTIINTYKAGTVALAAPFPMNLIQMAGVLATGFANVRAIKQTDNSGNSEPSASGGAATGGSFGPNVGIAGGSSNPEGQLLSAINDQVSKPARSFVVGSDVSTQQALDRRIVQNATFSG